VAGIIVFGVLALSVEVFLIVILTRHWKWLGKLGSKLRHFVLEIKSDDEQVDFYFFKSFGEKSWDLKHSKRAPEIQNGNLRNGVHSGGRAGFRNYGFSSRDLNDEWINSTNRMSCSSISINEATDGLQVSDTKNVVKNGGSIIKRQNSRDEIQETTDLEK